MTIALVWLKFALCCAAIGLSGPVLVRYGDIIAWRTGLSRSWIGLILLSTATSLPELFTGISAVTIAAAPDIAVGNVLGSCLINLLVLVVLDAFHREQSMYASATPGHILTAGFGVILIGFAGSTIILERNGVDLSWQSVSYSTPIMIAMYLVAMRASFRYEHRHPVPFAVREDYARVSLRQAAAWYLVAAVVVVASGIWLPVVGLELARAMGWGQTFVGSVFVAGATSLPELVVTISALRMGALDLALSNLLGSNLFNILVLALQDIAWRDGPLLAAASPTHAVTGYSAVVMTGIVIVALHYQPRKRIAGLIGWASISLLMIYLLTSYAMFLHGH